MKKQTGLFITVEGGEGAGKSTLIDRLADYLTEKGFSVVKTREPGGTSLGETIRQWLLSDSMNEKPCSLAELFLFLAARAEHIAQVIKPAIDNGKVVICDRFNDSTIAYQGGARGLGVNFVKDLCDKVCGPLHPDLTLYLKIAPEVGLERARKTDKKESGIGQLDRIESEEIEFHKKIASTMDLLAKREPLRICTIDATKPKEIVLADATDFIKRLLFVHV